MRSLVYLLGSVDECSRIPHKYIDDGIERESRAKVGVYNGMIKWIAFSFQSVRAGLVM